MRHFFRVLPVSAGFGVAERNEAQATSGRAKVGRGCKAQRSEAIPNRTESGWFLRRAVCDFQQSAAVAERSQSARRFQSNFRLLRLDLVKTPRHAGCRSVTEIHYAVGASKTLERCPIHQVR